MAYHFILKKLKSKRSIDEYGHIENLHQFDQDPIKMLFKLY